MHYGDILVNYNTVLDVKTDIIPFITEGEIDKYKSNLLKNRDLVFADAAEDMSVGKAIEINNITTENIVAGLHTIVARARIQKADYFLGYYINSDNYHRQLLRLVQGTKVSSISKGSLKETKVSMPEILEEQKKIGSFFKLLDETITLHHDAIQCQQALKKGLLQQLFPAQGQSVPELRFSDFNEEWEQRKLDSISEKTYGGGTPKTSIKEYWQGNFPWIQSSDLKNDVLDNVEPVKFITENAIEKSAVKKVPRDSIAIVTRVGVGKLALIPFSYGTSQDFLSLSKLNIDENFAVFSLYNLLKRELYNIQGTSIKGITKMDLLNKQIYISLEMEEQIKIGNFFKTLDNTIALHQQSLSNLKKLKQSLLQKMFI